ncbi:hypothetical protein OIDMADRAFT_185063 [Oidiodendron maius Zn]|uniref:Zn(2)-C6 fungal-type domain-containing protein n=1 Tax=Oidiodendron maius (strain Zn) TaxID=913774 RepID=A0A0C3GQC0_OIDMZ|nr:hypothetical protein OIDMADRAFT_185063 [Oidiodendron maius Zn]
MAERTDQKATRNPPVDSSSVIKRRQPESGGPPRQRLRYVAQACDPCKRQKVRCNGRKPCNRCERLRPRECCYQGRQLVYNCSGCDSSKGSGVSAEENGKGAHVPERHSSSNPSSIPLPPNLLEIIDAQAGKLDLLIERTRLFDTQTTIDQPNLSTSNPAPAVECKGSSQDAGIRVSLIPTERLRPEPLPLPPFHGLASSTFLIGVAHLWLEHGVKSVDHAHIEPDVAKYEILSLLDGVVDEEDEMDEEGREADMEALHAVRREYSFVADSGRKLSLNPLQELDSEEVICLIGQYDDLIGARFPFIETELLIQQAKELYLLLENPSSAGRGSTNSPAISMDINSIHILKMVLAIILVSEGTTRRALGRELFKSLQDTVQGKAWGGITNLKDLVLMILVGFYYFYANKLQMACRLSSIMVRQALELGLHRRGTFSRPIIDGQNLVRAVEAFWTIYVLDGHWSFAVGLPRSLQNADIDPDLPEPDNAPFLRLMIRYSRIGEQAWESLISSVSDTLGGSRTSREFHTPHESLEFRQYQLDQWQRSIPEELQFSRADFTDIRITFLRTVLHLRSNQMRIFMIRHFIYLNTSSTTQLGNCTTAMEIARDTIQTIADLHARSNIYRRQQALFNHFLVSALGLLYVLITRDTEQESLSSSTRDRLPPHALDKACSGFFRGLGILRSLGTSASRPWRLFSRLFPTPSQLKVLQNYDHYSYGPVDCVLESSSRFPSPDICTTSLQGHPQSLQLDPALAATSSSTFDITSPSLTQMFPDFDCDTMDMFDPGELYTAGDIY